MAGAISNVVLVTRALAALPRNRFVLRTDVKSWNLSEAVVIASWPPAGAADPPCMKPPPERFPGESRDPQIRLPSAGRVGPGFRGVHPLTAWREYRDITQADLASRPAVARDLIAQIETHKKQGSVTSLDRLARTLGVPIEALIAERG